eukprot:COSAG02_NODE_14208_length_1297_cov_1.211185_2_plen_37_part_01
MGIFFKGEPQLTRSQFLARKNESVRRRQRRAGIPTVR